MVRKGQRAQDGRQKSEDGGQKCGMAGWRDGWKRTADMLAKPHRRHLYQLLANEMGIAHWKVSAGYGVLQLLVGVSVMVVRPVGIGGF